MACTCRPPRRDRACAYCGVGYDDGRVCGVCREAGMDGRLLPGTGRRVCRLHKPDPNHTGQRDPLTRCQAQGCRQMGYAPYCPDHGG